MDYRKLCVELFGTDDEATLRRILQNMGRRTLAMLAGNAK